MQIHELNTFSGTPSASDYLVIDNGTDTAKVPATNVGTDTTYPTATEAQITTGTSTTASVVTPKLLHDYILEDDALLSSSTITLWKGILGIS